MAPKIIKVDPFDLVVFGGTGDLAYRKLFPSLFTARRSTSSPIRRASSASRAARWRARRSARRVRDALMKFNGEATTADVVERFLARIDYVSLDATGEAGWDDLKELLGADERIRAYYLATGPDLFGPIAKRLGAEGLATPRSRIIVEKPIGHDGASAGGDQRRARRGVPGEATSSASTIISARRRCRT